MAKQLLSFIKRSPVHRYVLGFIFVYGVGVIVALGVWLTYTSIEEVQDYAQRERLQQIQVAPATDFLKYKNDEIITQGIYKVGEPLIFTTDRTATADFDAVYVDRIFCPSSPRYVVERAYSEGSVSKGDLRTDWALSNYTKGSRAEIITIDKPQENCIIESTITFEIEGFTKQLLVRGDKPFDIVEVSKN